MADVKLTFACGPYDRMDSLRTGAVRPEGIDLEFVSIRSPRTIFDKMGGRNPEFDSSEFSASEYVSQVGRGDCQFVAPPWSGETRAPSICGIFATSGIGCPFASYPRDQFVLTYSVEMIARPLVRSSTKKCPLRAACAMSRRGVPPITASNTTAVCVESQSCVS